LINDELAKRKGVFQDVGIDINQTGTTGDVVTIQGLQTNQFDISDGGPVATTVANSEGANFSMIGATSRKLYYAIYASPRITSAQDLVGKNFGVGAVGSLPNLVMESWLRSQNIDPKSLSFAALGPTPEIFKAVAAGKVDAGVAGMDFLPEARRQGLSVLTDRVAEDLPNYFMLGIYVRADDLKDARLRETHTRFLTAVAQTNRLVYDKRNKDEWIKAAVELQARNPEDMSFFYDFMVDRRMLAANVEFSQQQVQYIQEENIKNGVQKQALPFERVGTLELQQEVVRRIGEFKYPA
ncbi:MAG: ABC transporter substrate-binding protein, partial [Hyphomicrobiales bacterium]|nr:ABC transporter substrate-binding protein [Hyphomicrobiales bacterium]